MTERRGEPGVRLVCWIDRCLGVDAVLDALRLLRARRPPVMLRETRDQVTEWRNGVWARVKHEKR